MGTLAEDFAAMPRSRGRASKRAKTAKGAKVRASSPSDNKNAAHEAASGGGVHPSSKISEVRPIPYCLRICFLFNSPLVGCTPTSLACPIHRIGGWRLSRAFLSF